MVYIRSRRFCCCLPVRFGVFVLTTLGMLWGSTIAAFGWVQVMQLKNHPLQRNDQIALFIHSIIYSLLVMISAFGLIASIMKNRNFVSVYSTILAVHLGFSIGSGIFTLYSIFRKNSEEAIQMCLNRLGADLPEAQCRNVFAIVKGVFVTIFIVIWLFQLYACIIVANYVEQLDEEDAVKWPNKATYNISNPAPLTTYNSFGSRPKDYMFTKPEQSYGPRGNDSNDV